MIMSREFVTDKKCIHRKTQAPFKQQQKTNVNTLRVLRPRLYANAIPSPLAYKNNVMWFEITVVFCLKSRAAKVHNSHVCELGE